MKEFMGNGEDGEPLYLEEIHALCWLIHAEGNCCSPFEFEKEEDARNFVGVLSQSRMKTRLEEELSND